MAGATGVAGSGENGMQEDMIAHWAEHRPDAAAIVTPAGVATYRAFDSAINQVAHKLRTLKLPRKGLVAVRLANLYGVYLLDRALDRLGLTAAVLGPDTGPEDRLALLAPDLFLTDAPADLSAHPNAALISPDWMRAALTSPPCDAPDVAKAPEDVVRIMLSSGTTGVSKKVPVSRASLALRLRKYSAVLDIKAADRLMITMGPDTIAGLTHPLSFWSAGASVIIGSPKGALEDLRQSRPTQLSTTPGHLAQLVDAIPEGAALPDPPPHVIFMGGRLSRENAARAIRKLSPRLSVLYGSTEIGTVTIGPATLLDRHEGAVGHVIESMRFEVVDADGRVLPSGEMGIVRVAAEGVFAGYLDDAAATAVAYRDDWFYPGDLGLVAEDGLLIIDGRVTEIMNLGGVKIGPWAVDERALAHPGVIDAAAFSVPDGQGLEQPWIAVVRGDGFEPPALVAALAAVWPELRRTRIAFIDAIPRNAMGKVERQRLRQIVMEATRQPATNGGAAPES